MIERNVTFQRLQLENAANHLRALAAGGKSADNGAANAALSGHFGVCSERLGNVILGGDCMHFKDEIM